MILIPLVLSDGIVNAASQEVSFALSQIRIKVQELLSLRSRHTKKKVCRAGEEVKSSRSFPGFSENPPTASESGVSSPSRILHFASGTSSGHRIASGQF